MKKLIIIILILLSKQLFSQYCLDTISIRVINSSGVAVTGLTSTEIKLRYSPYTSDAAGLSVSEIGSQGNYIIYPVTTYGEVELWISGVKQTWFGRQLVGCGSDYFATLGTAQTVSGTKTFSGVLVLSGSSVNIYYPYLSSASSWYSDYTTLPERGLVPKGYLERFYNADTSKIYYDGSKLRLKSGYKLYGYNPTTSPILINTNHFSYPDETNGLSLTGWNDSNISYSGTFYKDSTDELIYFYKFFKFKKPTFYNLGDTKHDLKLYYESRQNSSVIDSDSSFVINEVFQNDVTSAVGLGSTAGYTKIDSFYVDAGTWQINWQVMYERAEINNSTGSGLKDTIEVALKRSGSGATDYIVRYIYNIHYYPANTRSMDGGVISWSTKYETTSTNDKIYIYAKFHGQALENALATGFEHFIKRTNVLTMRVR